MIRVNEGTQPVIKTTFYDHDNVPITPAQIFYTVHRVDTGALVVSATAVTPANTIEVVLPATATSLLVTDKKPVLMAYTLSVDYPNGTQNKEQIRYAVLPLVGV